MQKPTALYYDILNYQPENIALLEEYCELIRLPDPSHDHEMAMSVANILFAPLGYEVTSKRLQSFPRLKVVASNTTGIPHIDLDAVTAKGGKVCALHDEQDFLNTITPTAEHTIGLMIAAWRKIPAAHNEALSGKWERWPWGAPKMFSRMSCGIVGYGRLGKKVADICSVMGMAVDYFDPYVEGGTATLIELATKSDVLSLHVPANDMTKGLVGREVLESLPKGSLVVNTARGELLDTNALLDLLESQHIYAAALDVINEEFDPKFSKIFPDMRLIQYAKENNNLILTPHIGGSTYDAWGETQKRVIIKAIEAFGIEVTT